MADNGNGDQKTNQKTTPRSRAAQRPYTPTYGEVSRRPAEERDNAFNALAWLLEGASGVVEELRHNDLGLSEEFWIHFYAARRESLLAARAFVDTLLEQTEQESRKVQEQAQRRSRRGSVEVEF